MLGSTLRLRTVERFPRKHHTDKVDFTDGVNIISGEPNTGKSKWLATIDFLLGDTDPAKKTLGDLSNLYNSASMTFVVGETEHKVERRWNEPNMAHKIILDDERSIDDSLFSAFILSELGMPEITFPQGPLLSARWRTLSWRVLLRHIYRNEDQWSDIAPEQPESEVYACLMYFLGFASQLFPPEQGQLVERERAKLKLEAKKDQFQESLNEVAKQILSAKEVGVAVTEQSVLDAIGRLQDEAENLTRRKDEFLRSTLEESSPEAFSENLLLTQDWAKYKDERERLFDEHQAIRRRVDEISHYKRELEAELNRFKRASAAGSLLAGIRVTHCPVCDQAVDAIEESNLCFLCHRPYHNKPQAGSLRIELEKQQIGDELKELEDLAASLDIELNLSFQSVKEMDEKIAQIETRLRPLRRATAAIQVPEIAMIDQEIGRKSEQLMQWRRILSLLELETNLNAQIDELSNQIKHLESEISSVQSEIDLEATAHSFSSYMNTYLNLIHESKPSRWGENNRVIARFTDRRFSFNIRSMGWKSALGGTWKGYLLLAYHYALMALSSETYYPGLVILDFPKSFEGAATVVSENANHTMDPFIRLCGNSSLSPMQVIAAGKGFSDMEGANVIHFDHQWEAP